MKEGREKKKKEKEGKRKRNTKEPNLIHEEKILSDTIGFKTSITYNKKGQGNIKIFYENLDQNLFENHLFFQIGDMLLIATEKVRPIFQFLKVTKIKEP